jgi:hypothetical protein
MHAPAAKPGHPLGSTLESCHPQKDSADHRCWRHENGSKYDRPSVAAGDAAGRHIRFGGAASSTSRDCLSIRTSLLQNDGGRRGRCSGDALGRSTFSWKISASRYERTLPLSTLLANDAETTRARIASLALTVDREQMAYVGVGVRWDQCVRGTRSAVVGVQTPRQGHRRDRLGGAPCSRHLREGS